MYSSGEVQPCAGSMSASNPRHPQVRNLPSSRCLPRSIAFPPPRIPSSPRSESRLFRLVATRALGAHEKVWHLRIFAKVDTGVTDRSHKRGKVVFIKNSPVDDEWPIQYFGLTVEKDRKSYSTTQNF